MLRSPCVLAAARALAGMSQSDLASAAGIAVSVLQAIEQGRSDPKLSTVLALLDVLKARGVELVPENDRVAWGVLVTRGSEAERLGSGHTAEGRAEGAAGAASWAAAGSAGSGDTAPPPRNARRRTGTA